MRKYQTLESKFIRYKDGLWIPYRKRTYLYWYKFLIEAEQSPDYTVDWSKYKGWGGKKVILNTKFDLWWSERWKKLFGYKNKNIPLEKQRFPLTTQRPKTEAIRISLLVWYERNTPPDTYEYATNSRGRSNEKLDDYKRTTRYKVVEQKTVGDWRKGSISKKKLTKVSRTNSIAIARKVIKKEKRKGTYLFPINPDHASNEKERKEVAHLVNRYKRSAKKRIELVCRGTFG